MKNYHIIIYTDSNLDAVLQETFYGVKEFRYMSFVAHEKTNSFKRHYHIYLKTSNKESLFSISAFPLAVVFNLAEHSEVLVRIPEYIVEETKMSENVFIVYTNYESSQIVVCEK